MSIFIPFSICATYCTLSHRFHRFFPHSTQISHKRRAKTPPKKGKSLETLEFQGSSLFTHLTRLVEISGIEPLTSWMPFKRSPRWRGNIPPLSLHLVGVSMVSPTIRKRATLQTKNRTFWLQQALFFLAHNNQGAGVCRLICEIFTKWSAYSTSISTISSMVFPLFSNAVIFGQL